MGGVKHLKMGKHKHLGTRATKMQSIIYTNARIDEARIRFA